MGRPFVSFQRQQDQIWFINVSRTLFFFVPDVRTGTFSLFAENLSHYLCPYISTICLLIPLKMVLLSGICKSGSLTHLNS